MLVLRKTQNFMISVLVGRDEEGSIFTWSDTLINS